MLGTVTEGVPTGKPLYIESSRSRIPVFFHTKGRCNDNTLADHMQIERHGIADSMATEDLRNGIEAFLAGEEAEFTGR